MKDTIKKSIIGGVIFFSTILLLSFVYAAVGSTWTNLGEIEGVSGGTLSSANWNKLLANVNNLNTKVGASAWVNFDGINCPSNVCVIRKSFNVSSVTRNATGDFTINFATPMADANYAVSINSQRTDATRNSYSSLIKASVGSSLTSSSVGIFTGYPATATDNDIGVNPGIVTVTIFD